MIWLCRFLIRITQFFFLLFPRHGIIFLRYYIIVRGFVLWNLFDIYLIFRISMTVFLCFYSYFLFNRFSFDFCCFFLFLKANLGCFHVHHLFVPGALYHWFYRWRHFKLFSVCRQALMPKYLLNKLFPISFKRWLFCSFSKTNLFCAYSRADRFVIGLKCFRFTAPICSL